MRIRTLESEKAVDESATPHPNHNKSTDPRNVDAGEARETCDVKVDQMAVARKATFVGANGHLDGNSDVRSLVKEVRSRKKHFSVKLAEIRARHHGVVEEATEGEEEQYESTYERTARMWARIREHNKLG